MLGLQEHEEVANGLVDFFRFFSQCLAGIRTDVKVASRIAVLSLRKVPVTRRGHRSRPISGDRLRNLSI